MATHKTLGYVYEQLQEAAYVDDSIAIDATGFNKRSDSPWFVQALMGGGGFLAAMFTLGIIASFIGLFLDGLSESGVGFFLLLAGVILTGLTTVLNRRQKDTGVFVGQLLLTYHIAGHLLLVVGCMTAFQLYETDAQTVILLIYAIILQMVFIFLYPDTIYRFLAMLAISLAVAGISAILTQPIIISIATGVMMIIAILVWADKLPDDWQIQYMPLLHPVGYGAMIGAFGLMIYEISNRYQDYLDEIPQETTFITTLILFACLLFVLMQLLEEYNINLTSRFALSMLGISAVVSLPVYSTPGILAGAIGIVLAFRRLNWILLGIACIYMAGFIIYYYDWLDVSLLTKSIILMITGILLIAVPLILRRLITVPDDAEGDKV